MRNLLKVALPLFLIVLLAFVLRTYKVTENPPALNWDEVSIGYNAYSILKTGKDEWGESYPIHFKAYGEYKLPAHIYSSIPGIAIFGLNEMGVRVTPIVYGTLTVLILFFLTRLIFQNTQIGLISAFLLSVSPWHIQLTRASFESAFSVFWILLGMWLLLKGLNNHKWAILSMIPFAISIYTYNSARVFTPLFLAASLIIFRKIIFKHLKIFIFSVLTFALLLLPLAPFYLNGEGNARYKLVSITDDPGLLPRINENRGRSTLLQPLPTLIHNKVTYISFYIAGNYLAHFYPDFLFISGAPHKQHHVQGMGELYWFEAPFLLLGLFFLFKSKQKYRWWLISWLLLAFIPVSVTNDSIPHALRTLIAAPVYQIITALGFVQIYQVIKKIRLPIKFLFLPIMITIVVISLGLYLKNYYFQYPLAYSRDWQYGYRQVIDYITEHQREYDEIVFSRHYGEPHMFTLFFSAYDPAKYQNSPNLIRYETNDWVWVLRFDKYYFPDLGDKGTTYKDIVAQNVNKKILFIGRKEDFPNDLPRLESIHFLNGDSTFDIVAN